MVRRLSSVRSATSPICMCSAIWSLPDVDRTLPAGRLRPHGSELMIHGPATRDPRHTLLSRKDRVCHTGRVGAEPTNAHRQDGAQHMAQPVSYTHLTLPTIYSV